MDQKLQELTDKIYEEGIQKAESRALEIVEAAEKKAQEVIHNAETKAASIVSEARKESDSLKATAASEIRLASQQSLSTLKNKITDLILTEALKESTSEVMGSPQNIKKFIELAIDGWAHDKDRQLDFDVILPAGRQKELEDYFSSHARQLMKKGITVSYSKNISGGFRIGPHESSFKISLTDADFIEFFKQFLRPKIKKLLFEK